MAESGSTLLDGIKVVATAGTRVQLPTISGNTEAKTVLVQALSTNEGIIVVGANTVVAAAGTHGTPTRRGAAIAAGAVVTLQIIDPGVIWLDATNSGDGVAYLVLVA